jgi:shikimate dehydrogenase
MTYGRILSPLDGFEQTVRSMRAAGMSGANVTVPFKFAACHLCDELTPRARQAGAVNTLRFLPDGQIAGDNTDGAGLVADLERLCTGLQGRRLLLLGAGGAVSGVLRPLLDAGLSELTLLNRTPGKAADLVQNLLPDYPGSCLLAGGLDAKPRPVDIVINGTASSLQDAAPAIDAQWYSGASLAYDMMYGATPTAFVRAAQAHGVPASDGLGMLAAQAAEAFVFWRGVRPPLADVLTELRKLFSGAST